MMKKTTFSIAKMDCPSEEQLIRAKLEGISNIRSLKFDISGRKLEVFHSGDHGDILVVLESLKLDTRVVATEDAGIMDGAEDHHMQKRVLRQVLFINFFFFILEIISGFLAGSMGLVADSLDMFADSIVYGLSLYAVGGTVTRKKNIAGVAGYFQLILALLGFVEVIRRFLGHEEIPDFSVMIIISFLALAGNTICLLLLKKSKSREAHMRASMIFTSTDVIANLGVIIAGLSVYFTGSNIPDLTVGAIIFVLVVRGACRILRLSS